MEELEIEKNIKNSINLSLDLEITIKESIQIDLKKLKKLGNNTELLNLNLVLSILSDGHEASYKNFILNDYLLHNCLETHPTLQRVSELDGDKIFKFESSNVAVNYNDIKNKTSAIPITVDTDLNTDLIDILKSIIKTEVETRKKLIEVEKALLAHL